MKLSLKFFTSFLLTFIILTVLMMVTMQFYAYRNFTKYVHTMEMLRLDEVASLLGQEYQKNGGWGPMKNNVAWWRYILHLFHAIAHSGRPPIHPAFPLTDLEPPGPPSRMKGRLTLFDSQKQPVVGPALSIEGHTLKEIKADGDVVGWLGLREEKRLSQPLDLAFLRHQSNAFYTIGILMVLLASAIAFFLSRHLLSPIRQLAHGTRALTSLRFGTKIDVQTGDELGQLASDFNIMSKTLERYEQMRKQWISDISHELRTPLAILQGEIEAIEDGVREPNREVLESLHSEVSYLARIVADLHDLSMADAGTFRINRQNVNPWSILIETLNRFRNRLAQEQITVRENPGPDREVILQADPTRLEQLFSNLLENVLRYVDKPGILDIGQMVKGTNLEIYFEDSGPGVPEHALECLFDRLYRVDLSRTRGKGGSGLGLAICKAIVEAHGGTIDASNGPSGGLRIHIVLP
ncbi:MAG: Signal transduction histidine-protein kinase BaeS [Syntrophorhabdus sp. PtaU1.Bin050]|nr:MAG: Signal transduction histidine-protein kinase BaeS [Syntrophorhabdus sp. PtaU1.Bin050]